MCGTLLIVLDYLASYSYQTYSIQYIYCSIYALEVVYMQRNTLYPALLMRLIDL